MYYHIEGTLAHKSGGLAVIDCGGVGYKLNVSQTTFSRLPDEGQRVKLFTHLVVKEDSLELIGFGDLAEKSMFLMLLTISGIGVKVATSVLSALSPERFAYAVASGDHKEIALAQGVSVKTAQKIILELKDKIDKEGGASARAGGIEKFMGGPAIGSAGGSAGDAAVALMALGYTRSEAGEALKGADLSAGLEDIIKAALRNLS